MADLFYSSRDHELRFTVHESPDYFRLKVSVFNDDKKTDLIGETWVDLRELVIPGGGQSDQWHTLQCRAKYAGEVRIEMTYYDTRPEDEAVIEKRSMAAERIQARTGGSTSSASTSGPRRLKDIKRRPLPSDPNGPPAPARPGPPEKNFSAPALPSTRPGHFEQQAGPFNFGSDHARQGSRHSIVAPAVMPSEAPYETSANGPPGPRPLKGYENQDDREWIRPSTAPKSQPVIQHPTPVHPPVALPQIPSSKRFYTTDQQQPSYREPAGDPYELQQPRSLHGRPHSSYETALPVDHRASWQDVYPGRQEIQQPPEPLPHAYETRPRQNSTREYPFSSTEQYLYHDGQPARASQRTFRNMPEQLSPEYDDGPSAEQDRHYQHHNGIASTHSSLRHSMDHEVPSTGYASMQPSVEDEEEEGPPPPPPVHRSGLSQSSQQLVPSPRSSFKAYSSEYASSPRASDDVNISSQPSSHYIPDNVRLQDLPPHNNSSSVPPSLVAGFDPMIADEETDRFYHERRESRRRSTLYEEDGMMAQPPVSRRSEPPYPADPPSQPTEDRGSMSGALVKSRGGSSSSDSRVIPQRKSVSPQPPPAEERPAPVTTQIPFSPDSYDALNPNASRSSTSLQAVESTRKSEQEAPPEPTPIIGDDGREIDPSDHLPSDTWAPEPEKKNRKPELVVRFKSPPVQTSPPSSQVPRESRPIRVTFKPQSDRPSHSPEKSWGRPSSSSNMQRNPGFGALERTSPQMEVGRGRDMYSHGRGQSYSRSPGLDSSESSRRTSISPSPGSSATSSLYAPVSTAPPIPAKVPIAQPMNQSYPMIAGNQYVGHESESGGIEALSRELNTIDIGSVGFNPNRAVRKFVPRMTTGYAS